MAAFCFLVSLLVASKVSVVEASALRTHLSLLRRVLCTILFCHFLFFFFLLQLMQPLIRDLFFTSMDASSSSDEDLDLLIVPSLSLRRLRLLVVVP